jgi:hypothetical protein
MDFSIFDGTLSAVNRKLPDTEVMQQFVRLQLGWLERLPWSAKLVLESEPRWLRNFCRNRRWSKNKTLEGADSLAWPKTSQ